MGRHHADRDEPGSAEGLAPIVPLPRRSREPISSWSDDRGRGRVKLGAAFDDEVVDRLDGHLEALLAGPVRFITVDATEVTTCGPALLALLGRTQHRLEDRRGLLSVTGLRPDLLLATIDPADRPEEG